jgi:hypothetical protein
MMDDFAETAHPAPPDDNWMVGLIGVGLILFAILYGIVTH